MRLLCDSHILLWWADEPKLIAPQARNAIANPQNEVFYSAVSLWELTLKTMAGKLNLPADFADRLDADGFSALPIKASHTSMLLRLPDLHRDPFDRMLVAQCLAEGLTLITRDAIVRQYPVPSLTG